MEPSNILGIVTDMRACSVEFLTWEGEQVLGWYRAHFPVRVNDYVVVSHDNYLYFGTVVHVDASDVDRHPLLVSRVDLERYVAAEQIDARWDFLQELAKKADAMRSPLTQSAKEVAAVVNRALVNAPVVPDGPGCQVVQLFPTREA